MGKIEDMLEKLTSSNILYKKHELQEYFMNNYTSEFIDILLKVKNPAIYHRFTYIMKNYLDVSEMDEKREKLIEKIILTETDLVNECFTFLKDNNYQHNIFTDNELDDIEREKKYNRINSELKKLNNKWLTNHIIYYFFHDNYFNFLVNLQEMMHYMSFAKVNLINKDHMMFYQECFKLPDKSFSEQVDFFKNNYLKKDIGDMFYDDMRIVKNHCYQNLIDSAIKINKENGIYNEELSKKYNYPIYYLNGENFYALVRNIRANKNRSKEEYDAYVYSRKNRSFYSFSYIGNINIDNIGKNDGGHTLLYDSVDPNYIVHIHHDDSGSSNYLREEYYDNERFNELYPPNALMWNTEYYNEIVIKKQENGIIPSALVCFDEIKDSDLEFPIILINSKKYHTKEGYTNYDDYNSYSI